MKKIAVLGLLAGLALCVGCLRTMAPILDDKDLIADASLAGEWINQDKPDSKEILRIGVPDAKKHYPIEYIDEEGKPGRFLGKIGRVGDLTVAEISPEDLSEEWSDEYRGHFVPLFSFYIVSGTKPVLRFAGFDTDWVEKYLNAHPGELTVAPSDKDLVTSSPEAIRSFLLKHWQDKGALSDEAIFVRREVKKSPG